MSNVISRKDKFMVAIIIAGAFTAVLNQTVMAPMLPSVMREFGIDAAVGQWATTIFMLVNGLMVPITAFLISRFSTRQLFFAAMILFTAGTLICATSVAFWMLLCGRVFQAMGAGIQLPFVAVTIMRVFPKERRGFALGINGIVLGCAPAFGPTFAGWLADSFGWRYTFFSITPIAVIVTIFATIFLRNFNTSSKQHLDWLSVAFSTIGLGGLLFGFSMAGSVGFTSPEVYGSIIVGVIIFIFFVRRQWTSEQPLLNLRVLKNRTFAISTAMVMIIHSGLSVGMVITPIFLQNVLHETATLSGLTLMPGAIVMASLSPVTGYLFDRFGPRFLCIIGLACLTVGTGLLSFIDASTSPLYITIVYTFRMGGMSLVNMPLNTWGINSLPDNMIAHGNAISNTSRQVASSIGTAILITFMMMIVNANAFRGEEVALSMGVNMAYGCSAIVAAVALVLAILVVGKKPHKTVAVQN